MVKDHTDGERGNPLSPHELLFPRERETLSTGYLKLYRHNLIFILFCFVCLFVRFPDCPDPSSVLNVTSTYTITYETTKVGSYLPYVCPSNFHPVGNSTCLPDGTWGDFACSPGMSKFIISLLKLTSQML